MPIEEVQPEITDHQQEENQPEKQEDSPKE